ncbi:BNR-4 repeat-containing protein [Shouchella clausii]|uniref:BNR-4 repeat-containing protein n=1 Tax=Shouchella clausii TaxID=79880 RepID=UPI00226D0A79|nr:BNR-4 repeat-containing protein [Shouchella clausii]MCY1105874.1 BNR-4 repeat-containing protein [Shouchella clausii]
MSDGLVKMLLSKVGELEKRESSQLLIEDAAYSWWCSPQALRYKGLRDKTYITYVDSIGQQCVSAVDHSSLQVEKSVLSHFEADDHNAPSIAFLQSGRPIVAYVRHQMDNKIRVRIGNKRESIMDLGEEFELTSSSFVTYSQIFRYQSTVMIFFRTNTRWAVFYSDDNGENWSDEKILLESGEQYYIKCTQNPSSPWIVRLAMTSHPTLANSHNIYVGTVNLDTKNIRTLTGTDLGNLETSSNLPLAPNSFQLAYNSEGTSKTTRLLDLGSTDTIQFAYCTWNIEEGHESAMYYVARWSANSQAFNHEAIVAPGKPIDHGSGSTMYFGGVHFISGGDYDILVSREENGAYIIEKRSKSGGSWRVTELARDNNYKLYRPVSPVNASEKLLAFWLRGRYASYLDYTSDILNFNFNY